MEAQIRIIKVGTREFLQLENSMMPVDEIERIVFSPAAIVNDLPTARIQIDCRSGCQFTATAEDAINVWEFLAP